MNDTMRECSSCGKGIAQTARRCPYCGGYIWHPIEVKVAIGLILFVLFLYAWLSHY
jgi:predicted amidophosphoribosyltransferase